LFGLCNSLKRFERSQSDRKQVAKSVRCISRSAFPSNNTPWKRNSPICHPEEPTCLWQVKGGMNKMHGPDLRAHLRGLRLGKRSTADPSTTLPRIPVEVGGVGGLHAVFLGEDGTRGSVQGNVTGIRVRSGPTAGRGRRDDKGEGSALVGSNCWSREQQVPPLRFAPVGMTN
jgi:hypothetical protein